MRSCEGERQGSRDFGEGSRDLSMAVGDRGRQGRAREVVESEVGGHVGVWMGSHVTGRVGARDLGIM